MSRIQCFPPVLDKNCQVLILGSLPGEISLARGEYYANPQNQFWKLLGQALGISFLEKFSYENRLRLVKQLGVGIGAAITSGIREGSSLDAKIKSPTAIDLLDTIDDSEADWIKAVLFEGRTAQKVFMAHEHFKLPSYYQSTIHFGYLPSASAAYAAMCFKEKARLWTGRIREHLDYFSEKSKPREVGLQPVGVRLEQPSSVRYLPALNRKKSQQR